MIASVILAQDGCIGEGCAGDSGPAFWSGVGTGSYKLLLLVHLLAAIAAFGPPLTYAVLARLARQRGSGDGAALCTSMVGLHKRVALPALGVGFLAGVALVLDSDKTYMFDMGWVSAAFAVVLALVAVSVFVLMPAMRRHGAAIESGDGAELRAARTSLAMATASYHVGLVVLVGLMVYKPGA